MEKEVLHPTGVVDPQKVKTNDPRGYPWSQAIKTKGNLLFIAGQAAIDQNHEVVGKGDMLKQTEQCLKNLESIMKFAGGDLNNIVSTIWFVTNTESFYSSGASTLRWKYFPKDFPTSTLVEIKRLANPECLVEVQAYAVL